MISSQTKFELKVVGIYYLISDIHKPYHLMISCKCVLSILAILSTRPSACVWCRCWLQWWDWWVMMVMVMLVVMVMKAWALAAGGSRTCASTLITTWPNSNTTPWYLFPHDDTNGTYWHLFALGAWLMVLIGNCLVIHVMMKAMRKMKPLCVLPFSLVEETQTELLLLIHIREGKIEVPACWCTVPTPTACWCVPLVHCTNTDTNLLVHCTIGALYHWYTVPTPTELKITIENNWGVISKRM